MLPQTEAVQLAIKQAKSRDAACANSLRINHLNELVFNTGINDHFCVTLIGDCGRCTKCQAPHLCKCLRDHFQSTTNSKRRVSTFLFWKNRLGLGFPVADSLLLRSVWSSLKSCECGIKQGNGQRKIPKGPVCINPFHYHPTDFAIVMLPLLAHLQMLGFHEDKELKVIYHHLGWDGKTFTKPGLTDTLMSKGFDLICSRVRKLTDEDNYFGDANVQVKEQCHELDYDSAYTSDSYNSSPEHVTDSFSPDSPPEYLSGADRMDIASTSDVKVERENTPPVSLPPQQQQFNSFTELQLPDTVGDGPITLDLPEFSSNGTMYELAAAQKLLPQMQARMWADAQIAAQNIQLNNSDLDLGVELAELLQPGEQIGVNSGVPSWMGYMNPDVQLTNSNGYLQFSSGVDAMDEDAYGMTQLQQIDPNTNYYTDLANNNLFVTPQDQSTSTAFGWMKPQSDHSFEKPKSIPRAAVQNAEEPSSPLVVVDVYRTYCKACQKWSFSENRPDSCFMANCNASSKSSLLTKKISSANAVNLPRLVLDPSLEVGDVVALQPHGVNSTMVVKLGSETVEDADTVGVIGKAKSGKGLRVNLVGYVDVKVVGPIRNLENVFATMGTESGVAAAKPSTSQHCVLVGQALNVKPQLAKANSTDINLVKCMIAPSVGKLDQSIVAALTSAVNKCVNKTINESATNTKDIDSVLQSVTRNIQKLSVAPPKSRITLKRSETLEDESVIALISHSTSKALQVVDVTSNAVNGCGNALDPLSHFVVHPLAGDFVQLQSACSDSVWLSADSQTKTIKGDGEPDTDKTAFKLITNSDGSVQLIHGTSSVGVTETGAMTLDIQSRPYKFTLYKRVHCE